MRIRRVSGGSSATRSPAFVPAPGLRGGTFSVLPVAADDGGEAGSAKAAAATAGPGAAAATRMRGSGAQKASVPRKPSAAVNSVTGDGAPVNQTHVVRSLVATIAFAVCLLVIIAVNARIQRLEGEEGDSLPFAIKPLDEVRWGIIGCGDVTEKKSGPALSLIPHSRLVMVMRRNATLAADYARRHNVPRWTTDADELINDPEVNAVYIATPPRYHVEYAMHVARAGKPAYVEKPMGLGSKDGAVVVREYRRRRLPLFVAYYRRALPNFAHIKELLDSGAIGAVRAVQVVYHRPPNKYDFLWSSRPNPSASSSGNGDSGTTANSNSGSSDSNGGSSSSSSVRPAGSSLTDSSLKWRTDPAVGGSGGYFRDKASHQLDLLQYWLGPIVWASGLATNQAALYPAEDTVSASWRFASGVHGTGSWCFVAGKAGQQEYGEITGSSGRIKFQFFLTNKVELWNETGMFEFNIPNPEHVQQPLLETVVGALRGEGRCPSTGRTALLTSDLMDHIVSGVHWSK